MCKEIENGFCAGIDDIQEKNSHQNCYVIIKVLDLQNTPFSRTWIIRKSIDSVVYANAQPEMNWALTNLLFVKYGSLNYY